MKIKTFILTFLMMMSCSFLFGQTTVDVSSEALLRARIVKDCTIRITGDFSIESTVDIPNGREITIDLNGHTLSTKDNSTFIFNNNGLLTIKDSDPEKKGTISACGIYNGKTNTRTGVLDVNYDAQLTIDGGVFKNIASNEGAAIYNYGVLDIFGGEFYGEYSAIANYGMATIKNAYIECLNRDNGAAAIRNDFEIVLGENVNIVGQYTQITETGTYTGTPTYLFAELNGVKYESLQKALDACATGNNTINLLFHNSADATVSQEEGVNITIDGNGYKNKQFEYSGTITVDGKSARYETAALTIKDMIFDATEGITYDACIRLGAGNNATRYTNHVTVENCTFTDNDYSTVAVKSYTGGDWNTKIINCKADGMHSLAQLANVEKGLEISGNTANTKNGINLNQTAVATVENNTINVKGYAVRIGSTTGGNITLNNNTLKTDNTEGDPVIELRGSVVALNMNKNVVSGNTHIKGTASTISVDENYWDGKEFPVVPEGSESIFVNSYYTDETLTTLERNERGSITPGYAETDRIRGEANGNAVDSFVVKVFNANDELMGTATLKNKELINGNVNVSWYIRLNGESSSSWEVEWIKALAIDNIPAKVQLFVDGVKVSENDVQLNGPDNVNKINAAVLNDDSKTISAFHTTFENAVAAGNNVAILTAGTYNVPTGKGLTITGAVDGVVFDNIGAKNMGGASVTFNNVTFDYYPNVNYTGLQHSGNLVYNNCTINGQVFLYGTSETFNNCTFNQNSADAYNVWTYGAADVDFNKCTFNSVGKSVLIYAEGASIFNDVNVTDCDFIASAPVDGKAAIEMDSSLTSGINLTIGGETTATGFDTGSVSDNSLWNNKKGNNDNANNDITVVVDDETVLEPIYVAEIGENRHRTLDIAIENVKEGETIKLLQNVSGNQVIIENKKFTLDLNNNTISHTAHLMFIKNGANVTIKNGTITSEQAAIVSQSNGALNTIVIDGVTINSKWFGVYHNGSNYGADVTVKNSIITETSELGSGIFLSGSETWATTEKVNKLVVENTTIEAATAVEMRFTDATITGSTLTSTYQGEAYSFDATSGACAVGYSIAITNNGQTKTQGKLNLSDNTLTGDTFIKINSTFDVKNVGDPIAAPEDYKWVDGVLTAKVYIAQVGENKYETFAEALDAVENDGTITVLNIDSESELKKEIEFTKDIEFTITGTAPNYALPTVTFLYATVNIKDAEILIPELDARQDATINVINSTVRDAGGNGIVKSYYNGAINIDKTSTVYTMQVTTMGYINVAGTLNATWQTNVYGNGLITLNEGATFNTAGFNLTAKDYSGRDNTDTERVGKPAEIVVDGANITIGKVYSESGADYSYNTDGYGINVGTIEGKSAILNIKNGGNVNIYTGDGKTANIGANGIVNVDASTFNVACRAENGESTLANAGTVNVTGESNLAAAKVTGAGWFYMNGVSLDADTKLLGAKVRFANGTNNIDGSTIDDGSFQVGIGAYKGTDSNVDTQNGVVVNVKNNAKIGSTDGAYAGWLGTGFYDTDTEKAAVMTNAKYVLNIENSIAEFGYLHVSNDGELNVNGKEATTNYNNSKYSFRGGDFIINGTANFNNTYVLAFYTKVSCDNGTENPGTLNINADTEYEAERHNGAIDGTNFILYKTGVANVAKGAELHIGEYTTIAADANFNIAGNVTALGTITNNGAINLTDLDAKLTTPQAPEVTTNIADHKVVYKDGVYQVVAKDYVAQVKNAEGVVSAKFESLAEAATAAQNGETIELLWTEGDPAISMAASFFGKDVTITGTATVDWSKGYLFVGRGGVGDATLTFDSANLTSASDQAATGIHVSGREKETNNKYDGTLVIKNNSNIQLDYLINRGAITIDNAILTVKNGFGIAGRPASETENGENATATISLTNEAELIVNNHNGMGVGQAAAQLEGLGIMNIDATSTFKTTQAFNISVNGTMNNAGTVNITGTLTNNGSINFTSDNAKLATTTEGLEINYNLNQDKKVVYEEGVYKVVDKVYVAQIDNGNKYESLQEAIGAVAENGTVTMLRDITLTEKVTVKSSMTLDLNGKTITTSGIVGSRVIVLNDQCMTFTVNANGGAINSDDAMALGIIDNESCADVTINDGIYNFDTDNGGLFKFRHNTGTFTLNNISVETNGQVSGPDGGSLQELVVNGGVFKAVNSYNARNVFAFYISGNAKATFKEVTIENEYIGAIQNAGGNVTVEDCSISVLGTNSAPYLSAAVAVSGGGEITINGGTYSTKPKAASDANGQGNTHGSWTAIIMSSGGTMTINDGTFTNGVYEGTPSKPRAVISVGADADYGDNVAADLVINGGTFNSIGALVDCETIWGSETDPANTYMPTMDVTITAGDFTGVAGKTIGGCDPISTGNPVDVEISGGTYAANNAIDNSYLKQYYIIVENTDGTFSVVEDQVAKIGDVTYKSLQEAFDAAQNDDEIVVLKNIDLKSGITVAADDNMTLDLNGKTISMEDASGKAAYAINNNGNLTIKDSAEDGKITFNSTTPDNSYGYATSTIGNGGILTINGGVIENTTVGGASYAIDGIWHTGEASLTINDGTITAKKIAIRQVPFSATAKNTVTINGGTFTGETAGLQMFNINSEAKLSETIIKGGTFNGTYAFYTYFTNAQASELATINIDGGTFNGYVYLYNGNNGSHEYPMTVAITDGLFNSGAYIYTKDANGNEVSIKAITGGTFSEDPSEYCAEEFTAIYDINTNLYSVIRTSATLERTLANAGWYWFSSYVSIDGSNGLKQLEESLGTNGEQIKNATQFINYYPSVGWKGTLTSAKTTEMYQIKTTADNVIINLKGTYSENLTIELKKGWNYIAYPMYDECSLNDALRGFTPQEGDIIKSKSNGNATYTNVNGTMKWKGNLSTLKPGEGYMYYSNSETVVELQFSASTSRTTIDEPKSVDYYWSCNDYEFANNMSVIAMLNIDGELVNDNYEIAAFANGECRGSARPIYVEEIDQYILFMTIHGEDVQELTFKYYDVNYGTEYVLDNRINYSNDAVVGSIDEPYMFNLNILNIDESATSEISIYPNPTTTGMEINLQATCDKVEVFNALGVKVAEYQNVDSIDAIETAGIYVIRITNDSNVQNCRLVVK